MLVRVLLALRTPAARRRFARLLARTGAETVPLSGRDNLWARLSHEDFDLVVLGGAHLPDPPEPLIASIRQLPERPEIVIVRAREDAEDRARLLASGCLAVLLESLPDGILAETLETLLARRRDDLVRGLRVERTADTTSLGDFVSASPSMVRFMALARRVVSADSALLILGETGVGKERLARAIHMDGPRAAGPFMAINCGALPESLLESELFGHEEGAFTGATRVRRGYFELAHRGTIFLDEIGDMPIHVQVKLLRVLEDRRVYRVGGERAISVDVRIMAATNRDLETEMKAKRFRPDLYYRLAVVNLTVPPLRERSADVPALVMNYLEHYARLLGRPVTGCSPRAMAALESYAWPGNVRELINMVERAVLLCPGTELDLGEFPESISGTTAASTLNPPPGPDATWRHLLDRPLREARHTLLERFERQYLEDLLRSTGGRIAPAATRAGVNARSLYGLMRRHGLRKESFKQTSGD